MVQVPDLPCTTREKEELYFFGRIMTEIEASTQLARVIRCFLIRADVQAKLKEGKLKAKRLKRPDFVWDELLRSFSTMGNSRGAEGLIRNADNYRRVAFSTISKLPLQQSRLKELKAVLRISKVRMPDRKAQWLAKAFDRILKAGGLRAIKRDLLTRVGRNGKIEFWRQFDGIGEKYSRNIMMDVYHPEFRDCIAIDQRIKKISGVLGLEFGTYQQEEQFYQSVARRAHISCWELDRILYGFRDDVIRSLNL